MIQHIIVVGGGSAGFLAALSLRARLPAVRVTVIRSREIGIIGVGEGSTLAFPGYLHGVLDIDQRDFLKTAQPTWKLGLRFLNWGPRRFFDYTFAPHLQVRWNNLPKPIGFYCDEVFENSNQNSALCSQNKIFLRNAQGDPVINRDFGYHLENVNFVAALESAALGAEVRILDAKIDHVALDESGNVAALRLDSGANAPPADLYVDCSGFVSLLLGKTLGEPFVSYKSTLFCDRAVVGGWERTSEPIRPYTTCEGMDAGWCWQIDHEHRINRGYVYSSAFVSDELAEQEFRAKNPKVGPTRVVPFVSGRYERSWVKNVVAIGNAAGFVEPLEATSLGEISDESYMLAETLIEGDLAPGPTLVKQYNRRVAVSWDNIRDFLAIHYKFNTKFETPFWRACRESVELHGSADIVAYFQENGPGFLYRQNLLDPRNQFTMEGYLQLLVGMKVPYQRKYQPPPEEAKLWNDIRNHLATQAANGFTVKEALDVVRSPAWNWNPDFYRRSTRVM